MADPSPLDLPTSSPTTARARPPAAPPWAARCGRWATGSAGRLPQPGGHARGARLPHRGADPGTPETRTLAPRRGHRRLDHLAPRRRLLDPGHAPSRWTRAASIAVARSAPRPGLPDHRLHHARRHGPLPQGQPVGHRGPGVRLRLEPGSGGLVDRPSPARRARANRPDRFALVNTATFDVGLVVKPSDSFYIAARRAEPDVRQQRLPAADRRRGRRLQRRHLLHRGRRHRRPQLVGGARRREADGARHGRRRVHAGRRRPAPRRLPLRLRGRS